MKKGKNVNAVWKEDSKERESTSGSKISGTTSKGVRICKNMNSVNWWRNITYISWTHHSFLRRSSALEGATLWTPQACNLGPREPTMCSKRRLAVQDYFHEGFKPKSESQTIRTRGQTCLALTFTTQEINSKKRPKKERKAFLVKELIFQDLMVTQLSSLLLSTHALNRRR